MQTVQPQQPRRHSLESQRPDHEHLRIQAERRSVYSGLPATLRGNNTTSQQDRDVNIALAKKAEGHEGDHRFMHEYELISRRRSKITFSNNFDLFVREPMGTCTSKHWSAELVK